MGLEAFLDATCNETFAAKTFKATGESVKKRLKTEDGSRADALLGDVAVLVGSISEAAGGVVASKEMLVVKSVLLKRQLARKPFFQKTKELVRDVRLLLEDGLLFKAFLSHAAELVRWKHTAPESLLAQVAFTAATLIDSFAHLENVIRKVSLELIYVLRHRHYASLCISSYASIAIMFSVFRGIVLNLRSLVSVLQLYHNLVGFKCALPELSFPAPEPISASQLNEENFLDFCSFGKLHLLKHNLGGGEENNEEEDEIKLKSEEAAISAALSQAKWIDLEEEKKTSNSNSVDEKQIEEWLSGKGGGNNETNKKLSQSEKRKLKREAEEKIPSNSFFSEIEEREKSVKTQFGSAKMAKVETGQKNAPQINKKPKKSVSVPSKQNFLEMLRKK